MYHWDSIDFLLLGLTGALLAHNLCSGSLAINLWAVTEREKTTFMTNLVSIFKANDKRLIAKVRGSAGQRGWNQFVPVLGAVLVGGDRSCPPEWGVAWVGYSVPGTHIGVRDGMSS